ncbi:MAG: PucR family transcriptional regulator [Acidimicrobiales bacterium]
MGNSESRAQESLAGVLHLPAVQEVTSLFRQFIAAAGNGHGAPGIARVLQQQTGMAVIVQDPAGRVLATSGVEERRGDPEAPWLGRPLPDDASHAVAIFDVDRWVAVACPRAEILGAISLLDPTEQASAMELFKLEQATTVLGWELLHDRNVAEAEVAAWGDFATELLEDSDAGRVRSHADRLGYDLDQSHRAVLVIPSEPIPADLRQIGRRVTARLGLECLTTLRSGGLLLVVGEELDWTELAEASDSECGDKVRVGVGGRYRLQDLSRSLADAEFALRLPGLTTSRQVVSFEDLGVWRLLARPAGEDLQDLVNHWIGALIDYDREHHSELLKTLFAYLNEFGALEATAAKLYVHRNSLRYRLMRITELTGWDLNDPEHRFHLNLACRAWLVRQALEEPVAAAKPASTNGNGVATGSLLVARRPGTSRGGLPGKPKKPRRFGVA